VQFRERLLAAYLTPPTSHHSPSTFHAMRLVGHLLQIFALVILPLGVVMELTGALGRSFGLSQLLIVLVCGGAAFLLGRMLEGYARG